MTTMNKQDQPTDADIEAIVAEALAAEASIAAQEAQPPSSAIVWWRSQMRARQEAARLAEKPITVVHAASVAAGIGLMLSIVGYAIAGVKGSLAWLVGIFQSIEASSRGLPVDFASPWLPLTLTAMLVTLVVASIAAYFIFADE